MHKAVAEEASLWVLAITAWVTQTHAARRKASEAILQYENKFFVTLMNNFSSSLDTSGRCSKVGRNNVFELSYNLPRNSRERACLSLLRYFWKLLIRYKGVAGRQALLCN